MSQDRIRELEQIIEQQKARAEKAEEMVRILEKIIKHQNSVGAVGEAVAVTADGKVYIGSAMPDTIVNRNKYVARLTTPIMKVAYLFCIHVLRLPLAAKQQNKD